MATLAKPNDVNITYSYEQRELLSSRAYFQGSGTLGTDTFSYYKNRQLATADGGLYTMNVTRGTAGVNGGYDMANRLIQETQTYGATAKTMSYGYTPDSLVSQTMYPSGTIVGRNYTPDRLLYQVLIGSTTQATFGYDTADRRISLAYANSTLATWGLDNDGRALTITHSNTATNATLLSWSYTYSNAGDPLVQKDLSLSYGTMGEAYQYDAAHRLAAYQRGAVSGTGVLAPTGSQNWTLTPAGDWSQWISSVGTVATTDNRTHNNIHAITNRSILGSPLRYDSNFNQTDDATAYTFAYDANDQLQKVYNRSTGALVASYAYDAFGRRVQTKDGSGVVMATDYYAGQQLVEQRDYTDALLAYFTYGDYIDEPLTMSSNVECNEYYYHANRMHSTYMLTDPTGAVAERYSYTAYGMAAAYALDYSGSANTSQLGNPFLFTGRELDSETLLYNYRARTYDPVQGRFKQLDPIWLDSDVNLYQYVHDNPALRLDPSGLFAVSVAYNAFIPKSKGIAILGMGAVDPTVANVSWGPEPYQLWYPFRKRYTYFATDDRQTAGEAGTSRVNLRGQFDSTKIGSLQPLSGTLFHAWCDPSHQLEADNAGPLGPAYVPGTLKSATATPSEKDSELDDWAHGTFIWASASAAYPFVAHSPSIDFNIEIHACELADGSAVLGVSGMHNNFPAYEVIVNKKVVYSYYPTDSGPGLLNLTLSTRFHFTVTVDNNGVNTR